MRSASLFSIRRCFLSATRVPGNRWPRQEGGDGSFTAAGRRQRSFPRLQRRTVLAEFREAGGEQPGAGADARQRRQQGGRPGGQEQRGEDAEGQQARPSQNRTVRKTARNTRPAARKTRGDGAEGQQGKEADLLPRVPWSGARGGSSAGRRRRPPDRAGRTATRAAERGPSVGAAVKRIAQRRPISNPDDETAASGDPDGAPGIVRYVIVRGAADSLARSTTAASASASLTRAEARWSLQLRPQFAGLVACLVGGGAQQFFGVGNHHLDVGDELVLGHFWSFRPWSSP